MWWHLRRGLPWGALLGCLVAAGGVVGLVHWSHAFAVVGVPVAFASTAAAAAFVLDEPALAATSVTPRGAAVRVARSLVVLLPIAIGTVWTTTLPDPVRPDRSDALLVMVALATGALLLALAGNRRQLPRPGAAIASAVVLAGLAPLPLGLIVGFGPPYPLPDLSTGARAFWAGGALVGALGTAALLAVPRRRPRSTARPGGHQVLQPSRHDGTGVTGDRDIAPDRLAATPPRGN